MFRNIIKKFALSLVADDIKSMIDSAVKSAMQGAIEDVADYIDLEDLASTIAENIQIDADEIARHVDTDRIAESVAENMDTDQIADTVAGNIDTDSVAESIAENIDMDSVAEAIDLDDLAKALLRQRERQRKARADKQYVGRNSI
jgi:hypothetical protein